jgi:hypothetical protein
VGYAPVEKVESAVTEVDKSAAKPADDVEQDTAAVLRAAQGLVLQATMLGEQPRAVINGQALKPGEKVRGFELREIRAGDVVLRMDGIDVRLER